MIYIPHKTLPNIITLIKSQCKKWVRLCGLYAGEEKCEKVSVGKPEGKRTLWRFDWL